jgi:hypothetical protein
MVVLGAPVVNSTIKVARGEHVLVKLGTDFDWTVTVSDPLVLARVPGVTLVLGAQGLYVAQAAGQNTISAVGDPPCRKSTPPCGAPSHSSSRRSSRSGEAPPGRAGPANHFGAAMDRGHRGPTIPRRQSARARYSSVLRVGGLKPKAS